MRIEACVTTYPDYALLEWRQVRRIEKRDVRLPGSGVLVFERPVYGRLLASCRRPKDEFYRHRGTLTAYVERHLPRP